MQFHYFHQHWDNLLLAQLHLHQLQRYNLFQVSHSGLHLALGHHRRRDPNKHHNYRGHHSRHHQQLDIER
jgi:hypothetical protein